MYFRNPPVGGRSRDHRGHGQQKERFGFFLNCKVLFNCDINPHIPAVRG